ncbi:MAG: hypothetical protein OHK0023_28650 [Anaerolineae bacterium]
MCAQFGRRTYPTDQMLLRANDRYLRCDFAGAAEDYALLLAQMRNRHRRAMYRIYAAYMRYWAGDPSEALAHCNAALTDSGHFMPRQMLAVAHLYRAEIHLTLGMWNNAHSDAQMALKYAASMDREIQTWAYALHGLVRAVGGDFDGALADSEKAIYTAQGQLEPLGMAYWRRGQILAGMGDDIQAVDYYTRAIDSNRFLLFYRFRAESYERLGNLTAAAKDRAVMAEGASLPPIDIDASFSGRFALAVGQWRALVVAACIILSVLFVLTNMNSWRSRSHYDKGQDLYQRGDYAGAIAAYTEALRLDASNSEALNARGLAKLEQNEIFAAIADFDAAIAVDANFKWAYYNRGMVYLDLGDFGQAQQNFSEAIRIDPAFVSALVGRGITYSHLERVSQAIADFERALEIAPRHPQADEIRSWIQELRGRGAA